jgi:hypothetical protein
MRNLVWLVAVVALVTLLCEFIGPAFGPAEITNPYVSQQAESPDGT